MEDFAGHVVERKAYWRPRMGQWVKFQLADRNRHLAIVQEGAHTARDGKLVSIFRDQSISSQTTITRSNGTVEQDPGTFVPPYLVTVDRNGNNLAVGVRGQGGHVDVKDVFFFWDSPSVINAEPVTELADLPPGRVFDSGWKPQA